MSLAYKPEIGSLSDVPNGAWYSDQTQTSTQALVEYIMTLNNTDFERGIQLQDSTKLRVSGTGLYNLMFSAQFYNSDGGGSSAAAEIWLKKNGTAIPHTGGKVSVTPNNPYTLPAWNYYIELVNNDYVQLAWTVTHAGINIQNNTSIGPGPSVPSLIVTLTQVG
jgi:hypothetical protein